MSETRLRLLAVGLLVLVLAVLAGLFVLLSYSADYAAIYAWVVLMAAGAVAWRVRRRNGNFRRWRALWHRAWRREQALQDDAAADPGAPWVRRRSRKYGIALAAGGVVLGVALGAALWLGDLRAYRFVFVLPLALVCIGVWMLVTGRHPPRGRSRGG